MKFTDYHSLEELDSFVGKKLKEDIFKEFSFGEAQLDGEYVLFSFVGDHPRVLKLMKVIDEIPFLYVVNPFMDRSFFTVLCFMLRHKITDVEIYGQCNIKVISTNGGNYHNDVIISESVDTLDRKDMSFLPDLNSLNEVFKTIGDTDFNNIKIDVPLRIFNSSVAVNYKYSLKSLLNRFNFKKIG